MGIVTVIDVMSENLLRMQMEVIEKEKCFWLQFDLHVHNSLLDMMKQEEGGDKISCAHQVWVFTSYEQCNLSRINMVFNLKTCIFINL